MAKATIKISKSYGDPIVRLQTTEGELMLVVNGGTVTVRFVSDAKLDYAVLENDAATRQFFDLAARQLIAAAEAE